MEGRRKEVAQEGMIGEEEMLASKTAFLRP